MTPVAATQQVAVQNISNQSNCIALRSKQSSCTTRAEQTQNPRFYSDRTNGGSNASCLLWHSDRPDSNIQNHWNTIVLPTIPKLRFSKSCWTLRVIGNQSRPVSLSHPRPGKHQLTVESSSVPRSSRSLRMARRYLIPAAGADNPSA